MTLARPASRTAASNGKSCSSRSLARPDVDGRLVQPALGHPVADHVLAGRDDTVGEDRALEAADVGAAERRREVRVLAVGLLDPAPARVARDVEDRRERVAGARREHPAADRRVDIASTRSGSQVAAAPIDCWKHGRVARQQPVERLLVDDRRDPEARLLDEVALDLVGERRDVRDLEVRRAGQAGDLADAVARAAPRPLAGSNAPVPTTSNDQTDPSWAIFSLERHPPERGRRRARRSAAIGVAVARHGRSPSALHRAGRQAADDLPLRDDVEERSPGRSQRP